MSKMQIVLAGVGGQGLVSAGGMLAEATSIYEKREALMCCAYGSEARGTFTKAEVIIDETRIFFPEVQDADVVIALHQIAYERYASENGANAAVVSAKTKLIYDSNTVTPHDCPAQQIGIPISKLAEEAGAAISQNVVMLGILSAFPGTAGLEPLEAMVKKKFASKPKVIATNIKSLHAGYEYAKSIGIGE